MALTPRSGSSSIPLPQLNTIPSNIPNTQADHAAHMPFVSDTNFNKFAIDTTHYAEATKQLVGLMKGKPVSVTYYRLLNREGTNNRTNVADDATSRNILDSEYQKIKNLEIRLPKGLDFSANNAQANVSLTGQAMFYPYMNPSVGDSFLMGVGDGQIGLCRVSSVTPMSWRQDRIYVVDFVIPEFVEPSTHVVMDDAVTITSVFSKENYLGGTAGLLSEQTYLQLLQIRAMRSNLCRFFHQSFYSTDINSYLRPDGIYDPFVTQFMANKITLSDVPVRAKNLTGQNPKEYQQTLWARLEDRYNNSLYLLSPFAGTSGYQQNRMGVFVTELYRRFIVTPTTDSDMGEPYLYSDNFYKGKESDMTAEELRVYKAITARDPGDLSTLITLYLDPVFALEALDQFYKIPMYIHLIDMSLQSKYREVDAPSMGYAESGDGE